MAHDLHYVVILYSTTVHALALAVVTDGPDDETLREFAPGNFENAQVVADFSM